MSMIESVVRDRYGIPQRRRAVGFRAFMVGFWLLFFALLLGAGWVWLTRFIDMSKTGVCIVNLRGIGQSLSIYERRFGTYPWEFDDLVRAGIATPNEFWCPMAGMPVGDADGCFVYIPGQSGASDPRNVLAYERRGHHEQFGINVLFADGHAENVKGYDKVMKLVEETDGRLNRAASQSVGGVR